LGWERHDRRVRDKVRKFFIAETVIGLLLSCCCGVFWTADLLDQAFGVV
jgi:hypothetical protein